MKHILSTLFPAALARPETGAELNLYFGHRIFSKVVHIPCVWSRPTLPATSFGQVDTGMPMLAYINRSQLAAIRNGPKNNTNELVSRLQQLRSKILIPADTDHDSYIVAVLLAMAQAHFYHESSSRSSLQSSSQGRKSVRIPPPSFCDIKMQVITRDEGNNSSPDHFHHKDKLIQALDPLFIEVAVGDGMRDTLFLKSISITIYKTILSTPSHSRRPSSSLPNHDTQQFRDDRTGKGVLVPSLAPHICNKMHIRA